MLQSQSEHCCCVVAAADPAQQTHPFWAPKILQHEAAKTTHCQHWEELNTGGRRKQDLSYLFWN